MTLTLNNTNTVSADRIFVNGTDLSNLYATINYVNTNSGGISQQDVDDSLAPLISKDISSNTISTHISLIDTNTTDIATHTNDIAVLNTKQIQNFAGITDIYTNLTNNYQTTTQLNSNFVSPTTLTTNRYTKTEIDATLGNYYTSVLIDGGFYNQTHINNNIYTKTEVDALVGAGGGYTDTQIDSFLSLKEDKTTFTDNVSFFPVIDLSRPSILHQGLTIKNSTINVEPLEGVLFSNQFGAETDRDVAVFKNKTNYITMKGNKINCDATSDDSIANLRLDPTGNIEFSNVILPAVGADLYRPSGNTSYNLRIRDLQGIWEFRNKTLTCRNASTENLDTLMEIQSLGQGQVRLGTASTAQVGIGANPNASYFLTVAGTSNFDVIRSARRLDLIGDMYAKGTGSDIVRPSGDSNYTLRVRNNQGIWEFRNRKLNCLTTGGASTRMEIQDTSIGEVKIGRTGVARVGIGADPNSSFFLTVGGTTQAPIFNEGTYFRTPTGAYYLNTDMKMYQRADAFNSLNIITSQQINFSLQSNKEADPTTATIALQLDDTNGITLNRAVVNNQTFNSIGNIVGEADIISWGRFMFQNSSEFKEVLDTQYKLFVRNGDALGDINLTVGLEASTPDKKITNSNVNLLGHLDITHSTVSTSERVKMDNPDSDGIVFTSIAGANILEVSNTGIYVNGSVGSSSDSRLKENINEVSTKTCYDLVKFIKVKEFNFKDKKNKQVGFMAQDILNSKIGNNEWSNFVSKGKDDYLRMDYSQMGVISWGTIQYLMNEITNLKSELKKLKDKSN